MTPDPSSPALCAVAAPVRGTVGVPSASTAFPRTLASSQILVTPPAARAESFAGARSFHASAADVLVTASPAPPMESSAAVVLTPGRAVRGMRPPAYSTTTGMVAEWASS